jgi:PAS domain S-box-containing protein
MQEPELQAIIARQQQQLAELEQRDREAKARVAALETQLATVAEHQREMLEKSQQHAELLQQAEQLRLIYSGAKLGTWLWDFSDNHCETFGTTEVLWGRSGLRTGQDFIAAIHPDDREAVERQVARAIADPAATYSPEFRVVRPDGTTRWILAPGTVFRDAAGQPVRMAGVNYDITEHKEAELALRDSHARLALALEAGRAGIFEWDIVRNVNRWSPDLERLYGLEPGSFAGNIEAWRAAVYPEDREHASRLLRESFSSGELSGEWRTQHPDGSVHWLRARAIVQQDAQQRPVRMIGINVDVTAQKLAEIALASAHQDLQLTAERVQLALSAGAIVGTWVWEIPSDRFTVDEGFAFFFGIDRRRGRTGLSMEEIVTTVHPDDIAGLRAAIDHALARGGAYSHEYRVRGLDGLYRWIEANGRVELGPDGAAVRFPGVLRDITERREVQRALRDSEARHRLFVESAPAAIAMFDRNMHYVAASHRWMHDFHLAGNLIGRSHYTVVPDLPASWRSLHARALAGEAISTDREPFHRADGTMQWINVEMHPWRDAEGAIGGILVAVEDVTAAVQAEHALRESEKLAVVGRLAAVISHEINNPLEAVFNLLYLSRSSSSPEEVAGYLDQAEEELKRVSHIVTHMLVFNRQSQGESLEKASAILESALAIYAVRLTRAEIHVARRYRARAAVRGMVSELRQVFANLIGNAFDAMRNGGSLRLRTQDRQHPRTGAPGVVISIADNGCGIDAATLSRIWEPFFTTKAQGTGLGLWVSRDIIKKHAGQIQVRSRKGVGTLFSIWLPSGEMPPAAPSGAPGEVPTSTG